MLNESTPGRRDQKSSHTNKRNCRFLSRFKQENKKSPRSNPTEMQGVSQNPSETALRYTMGEKQEAVRVFKQLLPAICASLDDIALWPGDASGKTLLFSASLNDAFVVALEVLVSGLEVTKPLSV